ncbi:transmembrane channel-like protein 5 isoform X1 [Patella vulgata]|uniref:transmembrane channel-like protein 5 isoform X1 n=1 Tax=Patella vulgata TaxID=6465 RepID=UPI0021807D20|nr:transmembrane channel-like protein 5 isoform X1 [Patella vulgata]XP_050391673.1 transmembrane channel-like protein 5 isoform X1 [Patella vulgata]
MSRGSGYIYDDVPDQIGENQYENQRSGQQYEMSDMGSKGSGSVGLTRRKTWAAHNGADLETARLLENLPSRQLENLTTTLGRDTVRLNHRRLKSFHGPFHHGDGEETSTEIANMVTNDPDFDDRTEDEIHTLLKGMTTTLSSKRAIRRKVSSKRKRQLGWFTRVKYNIGMSWQHFKYSIAEVMYSLELWKSHLKLIEGHFGTGVTSYFLFLKWLFLINIPVFFLTLGFVVLPQVLYRWYEHIPTGYQQTNTNKSFTGAELLDGRGWFENTELYYGFYTNETIEISSGYKYHMRYAYLFTCGGYYLLCLIILATSILRSYRKYYIEGSGDFNYYFKVFNGWDYGITSQEAAILKHKSLYSELVEYLAGFKAPKDKSLTAKCQIFWLRVLTNTTVLALLASSGYLIYYISVTMETKDIAWLDVFAMPLCITAINLLLPLVFHGLEQLEDYSKPKTELYVHMVRTMTLKAVTLCVLVNFWYGRSSRRMCWETFMGQEIYRLVIVDFIFTLLVTFLFEFVRKIMAKYCVKRLSLPEFNIGRNTLDLIYSQTLCWLGTFYCPLLSCIVLIKLFIIFYVKRVSVLQNCKPSVRPWRAARSHTIFLAFLFCFFFLSTVAVACGIIFVLPSEECGPYKGQNQTYEIVTELIDDWREDEPWLTYIIDFISSPGCIAAIVILLGMGTYYIRLVMIGHKEMVILLEQQLALEGKDKNFLLQILQNVNKQNRKIDKKTPDRPFASPSDDVESITSPGGRKFIRQVAEASARGGQM